MVDPRTPVLCGVGQVTNRRERDADVLTLMEEAALAADADAGGDLLRRVGAVTVVNVLSPVGGAPASALASRLGLRDGRRAVTTVGGCTPQWLVAEACDAIAAGEADAVLIAGGEALDSARRASAPPGVEGEPDPVVGDARNPLHPAEVSAGVILPVTIYALFESALAAASGRTPDEQRDWLGPLLSRMSQVAARHPDAAWYPEALSPEAVAAPAPDNRIVSEPYTKRMSAAIQVDQAGALILASAETASSAGVPPERWVFPWASAECDDVFLTAERASLTSSPALRAAFLAVFDAAGCGVDDVAWFDFYSCFPSAVQFAAHSSGLALDDGRGVTVTGGLPFFGGPGSNYVTHAVGTMAELCRSDPQHVGLVTGVSWWLTKHAVGLYSASPPPSGWRRIRPTIAHDRVVVAEEAEGPATIEAVTVGHERDVGPSAAPLYGRLDDGRRVVAVPAPGQSPADLSGRSLVGESVAIRTVDGKSVYDLVS